MRETTNLRVKEEVAEALKTNYLENDTDYEFDSMSSVIAFLIDRDAVLEELEKDSEIRTKMEDIDRNWRIAQLEEELELLKQQAAESQKRNSQPSRAQAVVA